MFRSAQLFCWDGGGCIFLKIQEQRQSRTGKAKQELVHQTPELCLALCSKAVFFSKNSNGLQPVMLEVEFIVEGRKNLALENAIRLGSPVENPFWRLPAISWREHIHPSKSRCYRNTLDTDVMFFIWTNFFLLALSTVSPIPPFICICFKGVKGFPGGTDDKESTCNAGDPGSILGLGRPPREGNSYPLQHSCLENSTDRGAWWATVHGGH